MRHFFIILSLVLNAASLFLFFHKKDQAYGIDFAGGQIQEYRFTKAIHADELRKILKESGVADAVIQQFDQHPENVIIRTPEESYNKVVQALKDNYKDNSFEILRIEKVGPVVGNALRKAALLAIIFAMGGILIYVGFRFKHFDFAVAGIIALLHDVIMALGAVMLCNRQLDLLVVTALLTIAGYSINDTIIVYDRIRENMIKMGKTTLAEIINISVNQTLSRTILTTSVTLLTVVSLFVWGGEVLHSFALCLLVGFITGIYSSVFIAAPIVIAFHKKNK